MLRNVEVESTAQALTNVDIESLQKPALGVGMGSTEGRDNLANPSIG